jgi:hypothetical protein
VNELKTWTELHPWLNASLRMAVVGVVVFISVRLFADTLSLFRKMTLGLLVCCVAGEVSLQSCKLVNWLYRRKLMKDLEILTALVIEQAAIAEPVEDENP